MQSTMQDWPLTLQEVLRRGATLFADSRVVTFQGAGSRTATYAEVARRSSLLAAGLRRLGIGPGDRVGTL